MTTELFALISARTRWLAQRHGVLTQNVANADTPDFRPRDLKPAEFGKLPGRSAEAARPLPLALPLALTQASHVAGSGTRRQEIDSRRVDGYETAPAGNAVVLDEQLGKLAETQLDYALTTNLYRRQVGMLKTALGSSQG
jgi:flagellar basal-body rod protein FlgB